ncbi:MAG: hypothetical protein ACPHID_04735 [Thermoplasmatota archaeon]
MRVLVLLFLVPLLAGCASSGPPPESMFPEAAHRFSDRTTEAFDATHSLQLPKGPHTLRVAAWSEAGFAVYLQGPAQREPYSGVMLPGPTNSLAHSGFVRINSMEFSTIGGEAGTWSLRIGCDGPCAYTVAVDEGNVVPVHDRPLPGQIQGQLDGDTTEHNLTVRGSLVNITMNLAAQDGIRVRIYDADGEAVNGGSFGAVRAIGWRFATTQEAAAGTWTVTVGCNGPCQYGISVR